MIQSIFLLSPTGEILIERHFRGTVTSRSVCDHFWEQASVSLNHHGGLSTASSAIAGGDPLPLYDTVPPVMEVVSDDGNKDGTTLYLFSVLRDGLSYLAACPAEVSPLLVLEMLHRIADIFVDYFGSPADETAIKDNFSTVYQLLEEIIDHGWPLTTEPNALQAMIRPSTMMKKLTSVVTGGSNAIVSEALPTGTISSMPWRRAGVRHHNNEIYIDIVEEIDAVIDILGNVISWDVSGSINAQSRLSGVPDLLLTFQDPSVIDDCSFHPCIRYGRYEMDQALSFVPPDGNFQLMRYRVNPKNLQMGFSPPIICTPKLIYIKGDNNNSRNDSDNKEPLKGTIEVHVSTRSVSTLRFSDSKPRGNQEVEDVTITIPFPKIVKTANLNVNMGKVLYDEAGKVAKWIIGRLDNRRIPKLTGTMNLDGFKTPDENPPLYVTWKIPLVSISGLTVSGLSMSGEAYKPYKGVRNITKSGRYQVRCN